MIFNVKKVSQVVHSSSHSSVIDSLKSVTALAYFSQQTEVYYWTHLNIQCMYVQLTTLLAPLVSSHIHSRNLFVL